MVVDAGFGWIGLAAAVDRLRTDVASRSERTILGIVGPPGAGKSTLAHQVVETLREQCPAVVAPMDGFHRGNDELERLGLQELKGVPASFDADAFVAALRRVRAEPPVDVPWPTYDRSVEDVVPAGTIIASTYRLVVVEGNYLLLETPPWDQIAELLDVAWYLDVPQEVLEPRLLARQAERRSAEAAAEKVRSTDMPNAALVTATKAQADVVLTAVTGGGGGADG